MFIEGHVSYLINGEPKEERIRINTAEKSVEISEDIADAVSFALFGKTVFRDIPREDKGIPYIVLRVSCGDSEAFVVRQPEYINVTHFGSKSLNKEVFGIRDKDNPENAEAPSLSAEEYFKRLDNYMDMTYDEFETLVTAY